MNMIIHPNDIKIKIKMLNSETLLAQATVILFDVWEEHGWKVLKSDRMHPVFQEEIWIQAPSYKKFGNWKELVFISERDLYDKLQEKIYDAYCMARNKNEGQESVVNNQNEEINIEDIPLRNE